MKNNIDAIIRKPIEASVAERPETIRGSSSVEKPIETSPATPVDWNEAYSHAQNKVTKWEKRGVGIFEMILENEEHKDIRALLESGCIVLDIGSGEGYNSMYLAEKYPVRTIGIDIANSAVEKAREQAKQRALDRCVFVKGDLRGIDSIPDIQKLIHKTEDQEKVGVAFDFRTSQFLSDEEKTAFLDMLHSCMKSGAYYIMEAFRPTEDNKEVAMTQDHVSTVYGKYFRIMQVYENDGTNVYVMQKDDDISLGQ